MPAGPPSARETFTYTTGPSLAAPDILQICSRVARVGVLTPTQALALRWRIILVCAPEVNNLVQRWLALLTEKQIRRGTHLSTPGLEAAIMRFIRITNEEPKLIIRTKPVDEIPADLD